MEVIIGLLIILAVILLMLFSQTNSRKHQRMETMADLEGQLREVLLTIGNGFYQCSFDELFEYLHDYFKEMTFGDSGIKWRINNADYSKGRFACDVQFDHSYDETVPVPIAAVGYSSRGVKTLMAGSAFMTRERKIPRYASLVVSLDRMSEAETDCELSWVRFSDGVVPISLWAICSDLPRALAKEFEIIPARSNQGKSAKPIHHSLQRISQESDSYVAHTLLIVTIVGLIGLLVFVGGAQSHQTSSTDTTVQGASVPMTQQTESDNQAPNPVPVGGESDTQNASRTDDQEQQGQSLPAQQETSTLAQPSNNSNGGSEGGSSGTGLAVSPAVPDKDSMNNPSQPSPVNSSGAGAAPDSTDQAQTDSVGALHSEQAKQDMPPLAPSFRTHGTSADQQQNMGQSSQP